MGDYMEGNLKTYFEELKIDEVTSKFGDYFNTPIILRLKDIGYFCGMDYASKDIYNFSEYISRYDHSKSVCALTYKLTKDPVMSISALFHDCSTPCFSHVIDYMNKDYSKQESTEEYTEDIIKSDQYLLNLLKRDNINIDDIVNYKKYSIVDNDRPKLCVDRLDGVILSGIGWTKNITNEDIKNIVSNLKIFTNEYNELEIGFKDKDICKRVVEISNSIDSACHTYEDNYMMELLAKVTRLAISRNIIKYEDLYKLNEKELFNILNNVSNLDILSLLYAFRNIKKEDIPEFELNNIKVRKLIPLVNGKRF